MKRKEVPNGAKIASTIHSHIEWSSNTFPKGTAKGALLHAKREIDEVIRELNNTPKIEWYFNKNIATEYADILGCVFDSINRAGLSIDAVFEAYYVKLQINKKIKWRDNGDGSYSHIQEWRPEGV